VGGGVTISEYLNQVVVKQRPMQYTGTDYLEIGKCACPIHQGEQDTFEYNEKQFNCLECNIKGNVVDLHRAFLKSVFGIDVGDDLANEFLKTLEKESWLEQEVEIQYNSRKKAIRFRRGCNFSKRTLNLNIQNRRKRRNGSTKLSGCKVESVEFN